MKKKIIITLSIIPMIAIVLILGKNIANQDKTFYQDGVLIAMTVDGETVTEFPDYENNDYTVDISCNNAVGKWMPIENDDYTNGLVLEEITGKVSCDINFTSKTSSDLLKSIVEKTGTSGNGAIVSANGYRYTGQEPNNYVWFNNEMWRIIGSIPVCTTASCGTGSNLVKIIRNESIGGLAYDGKSSGYKGSWGSNTLYTLLNSYYYGKKDGTNTAYCYGYQATAKAKCNYIKIGINGNDYYGKMIQEVYWSTASGGNGSASAGAAYDYENGAQTVKGHIGLMAASDYGYAASSSYHSTAMSLYSSSAITLTNWLYNQGNEWTSILSTSSAMALYVGNSGGVYNDNAYTSFAVRPVVYLDSLVYVTNGTGTISDPYMLDLSLPETPKYTVNIDSNNTSYGTVSKTSHTVNSGGTISVQLQPSAGYRYFSNDCGGTVSGNTLTISNVTSNKTCKVNFVIHNTDITAYSVKATSNGGGLVSPTRVLTDVNGTATFNLSPTNGYHYLSNTCGGTVSGNIMTIKNVTSNITCTVTFAKDGNAELT